MFVPFDFFSLVIAIAALIFARKAFNQAAALRARLDSMQTLAAAAEARTERPPRAAQDSPIVAAGRKRDRDRGRQRSCAGAA